MGAYRYVTHGMSVWYLLREFVTLFSQDRTTSFQLSQKLLCLEVFWDWLVKSGDNFVNLLFPTGLNVLAKLDGVEDLSEGGLNYGKKMVGNLNVVVSVVVEVEDPVELGVEGNPQVVRVLDALAQSLP